jgi:hypothetical protein
MRVVLEFEATGLMNIRCVCRTAADQVQAARALLVIAPVVEELAANHDLRRASDLSGIRTRKPSEMK